MNTSAMLSLSCPPPAITSVTHVEATLTPWLWPWAEAHKNTIEDNWQQRKKKQPSIFNGRVLLAHNIALSTQICSLKLFAVDYAQMLGALDFQAQEYNIWNVFAMGALQGSDGAYICGVMDNKTVNAGRVYFPAGTPDLDDCLENDTVDLAGSLLRELEEETGLTNDFTIESPWLAVQSWPACALIRSIHFKETAATVAERIENNLKAQDNPELSGTRIIRSKDDIDPKVMPHYLQLFFQHVF